MLCTFLARGFIGIFFFLAQDWETEHFYTFLDLINSMPLNGKGQDKKCWESAGNNNFKVSKYYLSLSSTPNISFPWKPMWRSKVPPRVAFFSWTAALSKILTIENLWYESVIVVDWCYMCKKSEELGNRWIIFFFIVLLLMNYGLWCGIHLVFNGLCRMVSLIYFELARFLWWASENWFMEGCPTLCPMVYLARTELKMFWREGTVYFRI